MFKHCLHITFLTRIIYMAAEPAINELDAMKFLNETNANFVADIEKFKTFLLHTRFVESFPVKGIKNGILMYSYPDPERLDTFPYETYENEDIKRQLQILRRKGLYALNRQDYLNATSIIGSLRSLKTKRLVCLRNQTRECQQLDLTALINLSYMSDDKDEILHYWKVGRNASKGIAAIMNVMHLSSFFREAAMLNGFNDTSDMWYEDFEEIGFENVLDKWILQLRPLYLQLHAYVRNVLREKYKGFVEVGGAIPQHLLGEMVFRASTRNLDESFLPYPEHDPIYFDKLLRARNHRFRDSLNMSVAYFESMGMMPLKQDYFDKRSRVSRNSKSMYRVCRSEHYDLDSDVAFRFCAKPGFSSFIQLHGDMAVMQYAMHKSKLPVGLNRQPCPGFNEAISLAASLSATSFHYLQQIGMPEQHSFAEELHLNMLFYLAIETLFPVMEHFVEDKLWLKIFEKGIEADEYNCYYWYLMQEHAGVDPPLHRTDVHFDVNPVFYDIFEERPATKIFSKVFGFHAYRKLCEASQTEKIEANELKFCTFYGNKNIGGKLRKIMSLGSKLSWRAALELISGSQECDASALLNYFEPLENWLIHQNSKRQHQVGWNSNLKCDAVSMYFEEELFV